MDSFSNLIVNRGRCPEPLHGTSQRILSKVFFINGGPSVTARLLSLTILVESPLKTFQQLVNFNLVKLDITVLTLTNLSIAISVPWNNGTV